MYLLWLPIGALKGVAYTLGWRYGAPEIDIQPTVLGELLTGGLLCGATGLLWWAVG